MKSEMTVEEATRLLLLERGIYYGTSSRDRKRGRARHITNQCTTGTIIIRNLWHLMGVTEFLCVCSVCKDVNS